MLILDEDFFSHAQLTEGLGVGVRLHLLSVKTVSVGQIFQGPCFPPFWADSLGAEPV